MRLFGLREGADSQSASTLVATSLAHFVNDGSLYILITLYSKLLPSEYLLIGILGALQNTFSVAVGPIVGRKADASKSYGKLLSIGILFIGVGILGYSASTVFVHGFSRFIFLLPFSVLAGIGSCFYHPIGAAAIHDKWTGKKVGWAMGVNGSIGSLGRATYPLFTIALVVYLTIPSVGVLAAVAFVSASLIASMLRGVQFGRSQSVTENAKSSEIGEVPHEKAVQVPLSQILPRVLGLTIIAFSRSLLSQGIVYFVPSYISRVLGIQYGFELGVMFSLMLGMAVVGQPVFGSIADRIGRKLTLGIAMVGTSIGLLLFLQSTNVVMATIFLSVFGFFVFTGFPLIMPLATSIVPEGAGVMSGSIVWGVGIIGGGAVGPLLVGVLAQPFALGSLSIAFYVLAFAAIASIALLPSIPKMSEENNGARHH